MSRIVSPKNQLVIDPERFRARSSKLNRFKLDFLENEASREKKKLSKIIAYFRTRNRILFDSTTTVPEILYNSFALDTYMTSVK